MKALRPNVAIAIDGGGLRGVMVARALTIFEQELGKKCGDIARLAAGTSTGSIISAGIGVGMSAAEIHKLYCDLASVIFRKSWRSVLWPIATYRYANDALIKTLKTYLGEIKMSDFWKPDRQMDVVITARDLVQGRTLFVKPWKNAYKDWPVWRAVVASCTVPTYFPVVEGCFVDGGAGSYSNPCYVAAYEAVKCLKWKPEETTLISLGTGRVVPNIKPYQANRFLPLGWLTPLIDTFLADSNQQQVRVVQEFFPGLDFRRFQIDIPDIPIDEPKYIQALTELGNALGQKIVEDESEVLPPAAKAEDYQ